MFELFRKNLQAQKGALARLKDLLEEEFSRLMNHDPQAVSGLELKIQELLRELRQTRLELREAAAGGAGGHEGGRESLLADRLNAMPSTEAGVLRALLEEIDAAEQARAQEAARNQGLVLALHEQNKKLLGFLHDSLAPKAAPVYSAAGRYVKSVSASPALMARRL